MPDFSYENCYLGDNICGIDEAGRGPLAGPVVAACVELDLSFNYSDINDSKKITPIKRSKIYKFLIDNVKYGIGVVDNDVIDRINILEATKLAMLKSYQDFISKYQKLPEILLIDGNFKPFELCDNLKLIKPIIKGDQKSLSIAASSIIAKEYRDLLMNQYHLNFPQYEFNRHKGYPTKNHIAKIKQYGIIKIHRHSFGPIKALIDNKTDI